MYRPKKSFSLKKDTWSKIQNHRGPVNTPRISGDKVKDILSPVSGLTLYYPDSDTGQLRPRSGTKKTYVSK